MSKPTKHGSLMWELRTSLRELTLAIEKVKDLPEEDLAWLLVSVAGRLRLEAEYATRVIIGFGEPETMSLLDGSQREDRIYWNREGLVRCWRHCPPKPSTEWRVDRWRSLTPIELEEYLDSKGRLPSCTRCGKGPVLESLNSRRGDPPQVVRDLELRPHAGGRKSSR